MKVAFSTTEDRIAPVFDVARQIHILDIETDRIVSQNPDLLPNDAPGRIASHLLEFDVDTLVCGAVSRHLQAIVAGCGIRVIPFVTGELNQVIRAFREGTLESDVFAMPGCCGRNRRRRGMSDLPTEDQYMQLSSGRGKGQGHRGQGRGRMGGPSAGRPVGRCVCPKCGHEQPHVRGEPCVQKSCPECGTELVRE